jgi:hypothetical protein
MAKEFTDYIIMVLGSGDRVYHLVHLRYQKGKLYNPEKEDFKKAIPFEPSTTTIDGHKYLLNLDRAYRVNWTPWKKFVIKKRYWKNFYKPLIELTRSKKVGLLLYQEPNPPVIVEDKIPIRWLCSACDFETESPSGIKIHIKAKHTDEKGNIKTIEPPEVINKIVRRTVGAREPTAPMHISRIHQPSGVMKG